MATKAVRGQKLANELVSLADKLEGRFRKAFLRSMLSIAEDPELQKLIRDIEAGRFTFGDAIDARLSAVRIDLAEMNEIARQAIAGSAKVTNQVMGLKGSFDVINDSVVNAAKNLSIDLSTYLRKSTQETLRQIIEDLIGSNISRSEAVRRITLEVGLLPQHAKAVSNYRRTLIAAGESRSRANQLAEAYAKRLLKYRANMISRTEVARATGIGQTEFWRQMRDQGSLPPQVNRVWITSLDERACDFCRSMNGQVASIDGGWETINGYKEYPQASHPHCRCSSGITTNRMTKTGKMGVIAKVEEIEYEYWLSKFNPNHDEKGRFSSGSSMGGGTPVPAGLASFGDESAVFSGSAAIQKSLSAEEKESVADYTARGYVEINGRLRSVKATEDLSDAQKFSRSVLDEKIALLDTVFEKSAVTCKRDMYLHRGTTLLVKKKEFSESWVSKLKTGDVIEDKAFVSTSAEKGTAQTFSTSGSSLGVIFTIKVPKGTKVMAGLDSEEELILNRGSKTRVVSVTQIQRDSTDNRYNVEVELELIP
jgi:hypothetical protein